MDGALALSEHPMQMRVLFTPSFEGPSPEHLGERAKRLPAAALAKALILLHPSTCCPLNPMESYSLAIQRAKSNGMIFFQKTTGVGASLLGLARRGGSLAATPLPHAQKVTS